MKPGIPRLFPSIASFGLRNYKAVVCAVLLLVIVSPFVLGGLRLETVTASLSSPDDSFSQIYNRNMQLFGEGSPLVIRLEYSETPIQTLNLFTDALAKDLRTWDDILCVEYKALDLYDPFLFTTMLRAALLNADPAILSEFMAKFSEEGLRSNLRKSRKRLIALDDPSLRQRVTEDILDIFSLFLPALESRLNSGGFSFEQGYFDSAKENARLIFIFPAKSAEDAPYSVRLISQIEDVQNELKSSIAGADSIRTSFAGKYAISGETMVEYRRNLFLITITASLAVFLLLLLVFRNIRALIIAFVPIMISLIAVFMIARFFFNPINYLSMAFAAIIIGIGVDVMLHCTGRFFQLREKK